MLKDCQLTLASMYSTLLSSVVSFSFSVASFERQDISDGNKGNIVIARSTTMPHS